MEKCVVCGKIGEKHHIVFKNQGGLDIPLNYIYLCSEHHRGKNGPHKNAKIDIFYKLKMQDKLIKILYKEYYNIDELALILNMNLKQAICVFSDLQKYKYGYKRKDIIKKIMGEKFYYECMLYDCYDESWNIHEDELIEIVLIGNN